MTPVPIDTSDDRQRFLIGELQLLRNVSDRKVALAIEKKDEEEVLRSYASSGGRGRVEALLLSNAPEPVKRSFRGYTDLLKYWRDETAHGRVSQIAADEAYVSLLTLLRLAQFARDHWDALTVQ